METSIQRHAEKNLPSWLERHATLNHTLNRTHTNIIGVMNTPKVRRARGTGLDNVILRVDVSPAAKDLVNRVSDHTGLSKGQITEMLLLRIPLDSRGLPLWDDIDNFKAQGALPIDKAS